MFNLRALKGQLCQLPALSIKFTLTIMLMWSDMKKSFSNQKATLDKQGGGVSHSKTHLHTCSIALQASATNIA